jgi:acyl-CoA synthetase (NDP forming)
MVSRLATHSWQDRMQGVMVQPMVREGLEAIVGMTQDPSFGPLLMFGLGGVQVELLKDVAFRVHPLTDRDARELVRSVRGFPLLGGWRGSPPGDVDAIEEVLLRVSQLAGDLPEVAEMDLNPVRVLPPGRGCMVVDARIAVTAT